MHGESWSLDGGAEEGQSSFLADRMKAPDGCKGTWTNAQRLPRRGELPEWRQRINPRPPPGPLLRKG